MAGRRHGKAAFHSVSRKPQLNDARIEHVTLVASHGQQGPKIRRSGVVDRKSRRIPIAGRRVEELPAKLQADLFANAEVLREREIAGALTRREYRVPAASAQRPQFRGHECPRVELPCQAIHTVTKKIQLRFYPLPNFGDTSVYVAGNYRDNVGYPYRPKRIMTSRVERRLGDKDFVFARYSLSRRTNGWSFRATLVNEVRFGHFFNHNPNAGPINGLEQVRELGLQGLALDLPDWSGFDASHIQRRRRRGRFEPDRQIRSVLHAQGRVYQDQPSYFRGQPDSPA